MNGNPCLTCEKKWDYEDCASDLIIPLITGMPGALEEPFNNTESLTHAKEH